MTPPDHVGDDPVPHAGAGSQGLSTARLAGLLNGTYEQMATPLLRRRHLPTVVDALSILGEVPTVTFATSTTIASGTTTGVKRLGNVTGADGDLAGDPTFLIGGTTGMPANAASPSNRVRAGLVTGGNSARYVPTFNFYTDASAFEFNVVFPGSTFDYRPLALHRTPHRHIAARRWGVSLPTYPTTAHPCQAPTARRYPWHSPPHHPQGKAAEPGPATAASSPPSPAVPVPTTASTRPARHPSAPTGSPVKTRATMPVP